jgi:2-keto-4-pentenoate hydratase/2-oxohepta-3-ene-1,7-dioic acid hydratase in catechol pathway
MKICRFNGNRLGVVSDDVIHDITERFDRSLSWPLAPGDAIARQLVGANLAEIDLSGVPRVALGDVRIESPIANPGKIIGAPINYKAHIEEANADKEISHGHVYTSLDQYGLFLKAGSSLIGPHDKVIPRFPDRRTDHEVELAVVIGRVASRVTRENALDHVLGYTVGLDMTVRGKEFPTFRKSPDTYCVLGPWLVTPDEVPDPNQLALKLSVNGEVRQNSNTRAMIFDVQRLIEYASTSYTLYPGDIIMTGTPDGVGPVEPGDLIEAEVAQVGRLSIVVG